MPADLIGPLRQLRDAAALAVTSPPARRIIALAPVTVDCEQLAVAYLRSYRGSVGVPASDPRSCPPGRVIEADVMVMRCYPVMDRNGPPSDTAITAATEVALADAIALEVGIPALLAWRQGDGVVPNVSALRVQGGYAGIAVRVAFRVV